MALVRYEPWNVLGQLHGQINRILEKDFEQASASSAATADWIPPADVEEYSDRFVLKLDVPGVDIAAVEITLDQATLDRLDEIFPGHKTAPEDYAW